MTLYESNLDDKNFFIDRAINTGLIILCASSEVSRAFNRLYNENHHEREYISLSVDDLVKNRFHKKNEKVKKLPGFIIYDLKSVVTRLVNFSNGKFVNIFESHVSINDIIIDSEYDEHLSCDGCIHSGCYYQDSCGYCDKCHKYSNHSYTECTRETISD